MYAKNCFNKPKPDSRQNHAVRSTAVAIFKTGIQSAIDGNNLLTAASVRNEPEVLQRDGLFTECRLQNFSSGVARQHRDHDDAAGDFVVRKFLPEKLN